MLHWIRDIGSVRRWVPLAATVLCLALSQRVLRPAPGNEPLLNVLVITLDTTRADAVGAYGGRAVTPGFDQLARTGVLFEHASTVAPLTLPAHCSLFTGVFPPRHQVHENGERLSREFQTLASLLSARGFQTAAFTSSFVLDAEWGLNRGFNVYRGVSIPAGNRNADWLRRPADRVADEALEWLQAVHGRRFFAWLHFYDAHAPAQPPPEFASPNGQDSYHGAIGFVDLQLSRVTTFLDERGLLDRTIVVVVGDHGESLGEHGEAAHGLFVYQSVIHVPLLIRAPAAGIATCRVADPVRIVDVMPTVLDLLGEPAVPGVDGRSLRALMRGAVNELELDVYSESRYALDRFGWSPLMALRRGPLKLILAPRPELYDLDSDPHEQTNLYPQHTERAAGLMQRLREIGQADRRQRADDTGVDPTARARLASLGYVSGPPPGHSVAAEPLADPKDRIDLYRQFTDRPQQPGVVP